MSTPDSEVVRLDPDDPVQVDAIARLHTALLPESFTARIGHYFMTRFYFTHMVRSDLVAALLYRHEGEFVGFSVFTKYPDRFLREGIRRHFAALCRVSAISLLADPRRLAILAGLMRRNDGRTGEHDGQGGRVGYWLTFGVLETHRRLRLGERGQRISILLVRAMIDYFRREGFVRLDGGVERENKSAIFFYHSIGFTIDDPREGPSLQIHLDLTQD